MAAANETRIVLTAEDRTSAALQSVTRGLQGMESSAMLASRALGAIGVTFSAAAAVAMVKGTIDAADGFNDLSQKVGISVRQLAGWTLAANQSGTSMESVAKGVKGLSTYMMEHGDRLKAAGITATDANGAMVQLADLFKAMPDGVEKTALAVQLFGKAGMDMIPMLNMGSQGLAEAQAKADAYGKKMAELAPMADAFNDQLEELALHSKAAGMNITAHFLPGLVGLSTWLNDVASGGKKAWNAVAWAVGGLPEGVTLGDADKPAAGAAAAAASSDSPSERARKLREDAAKKKSGAGQTPLQRMLAAQQKRIAELNATYGDEQMVSVDSVSRQYEKKATDALEERRIAMEKMAERRMEMRRIETEGEEAVREEMEKTAKVGKDSMAGLTDAIENWGNRAADTFADFVVDGKASFSDLVNSILKDIARLQAKKILDPITKGASDWLSGALGKGLDGVFGGGGDAAPEWNPEWSFAGGGFTGNGARTGGLDGQGGFLAMLHPRETVIDHTTGAGTGGGVTVVQHLNFSVGVAQTVRAEIMNLMPQIQAASQSAVMDARLRGGSARTAFRG